MEAHLRAVEQSFLVAGWLATEMNGVPIPATLRNRVAGACFSVAQDHHCGIVLLLRNSLNAPAFALLRLEFEAYIRGLWSAHCANDAQVTDFAAGTEPPRLATMLEEIEACEAYSAKTLSDFKAKSWSAMCSYAHTGGLQVQRWQTETSIESSYAPNEIEEVANTSASFALLSGVAIAVVANNEPLAARLLERSRAFAIDGA